jgi:uncharacterized protein YeeX (DUF496 family)
MFKNEFSNRIKLPAQCCVNCGKSYKKKENLNKHLVVCELLERGKKKQSIKIEEDEEETIPSQKKLFEMLIDLGIKYSRLEEKVEEINKWIVKKKKKINVLEWLNSNVKPTVTFEDIIDKINVNEEDISILLQNTFYDVLNNIFTRTIFHFSETENPIFTFVQKPNKFYIYDSNNVWSELTRENFIKFLNKIHSKIFKEFYEWKKNREIEIKTNEKMSILCNKTLIKIMDININEESVLSKIKSSMFSRMKTDMKAIIEYEFEF